MSLDGGATATPYAEGVSVVIPHYGDPALATQAAACVLAQEFSGSIDVVVVDDASPTPMPDLDEVRVLRRERNGGFGAAVNTGAAQARSPWLLILNSDIELAPTDLQNLIGAAEQHRPALVSPQLVGHGRPQPTASTFAAMAPVGAWARSRVLARWRARGRFDRLLGHDLNARVGERSATEWVTGACLLLPTDLFWSVGGFDEAFHMFHEEIDLQFRLRAAGASVWYLGDVAVEHVGGGSTDTERRAGALLRSHFVYAQRRGFAGRLLLTSLVVETADSIYLTARRLLRRTPEAPSWRVRVGQVLGAYRASRRLVSKIPGPNPKMGLPA